MSITVQRSIGFPRVDDDMQRSEGRDELYATGTTLAEFAAAVPQKGSECPFYDGLYLLKRQFSPGDAGSTWWKVSLTYAQQSANPGDYHEDYDVVTTFEDNGVDKDLEAHVNAPCGGADYKTQWNYYLAAKHGESCPAFYATATTLAMSDADAAKYRWIKDPSELPCDSDGTRWWICGEKTKPGVDKWIQPAPVVCERWYFRKEKDAEDRAKLLKIGDLYIPKKSYGFDEQNFIVIGTSCQQEGRYWVFMVRAQWSAAGWDTDIYG